ncbi:MAG: hypothetical protein KDA21_10175, partial [Phycisphaerales bacterium]|nr:hypothetical protein [Phycisphaerales bacterium]
MMRHTAVVDASEGRHHPVTIGPDEAEGLMISAYEEMKALALRHMRRERRGHTLQATALVHEAYL